MNIGCIECGVKSDVVGVFTDEKIAEDIAARCAEKYSWRQHGRNEFEIFELPSEPDQINVEYEIGY